MKLASVLGRVGEQLDTALIEKGQSPSLKQLGEADAALRYVLANLRASYLFSRHTVPSYISHVFRSLTERGPVDDSIGSVVRSLIGMCSGELCTNNVYRRPHECHSHFYDLYEAYVEAGGSKANFDQFMETALKKGTLTGIRSSSSWSQGSLFFANKLLPLLEDPLATFILMPCNEVLTTIVYPVALQYLPKTGFDLFRHFISVHVQLDGDDHGQAALDWLASYVKTANVTQDELNVAAERVLSLYKA